MITWAPLHSLDDEARVIDRTGVGDWTWKGKSRFGLGLSAARTTGTTNSSSTSYRPAPAGPFACERVWILARSEGRLTQSVGLALQESLLADDRLTELAYFPLSDQPLAIERPPDLYVTIEVRDRLEVQAPFYHRLKFDLRWCIGRRPFHNGLGSARSDDRSPHATGQVERSETSWGLVSAAARYHEAVAAVLDAIELEGQIADWRKELGTMASVPLEHAGEKSEPADLPFLSESGLSGLYSATPFLTHGEHAWSLDCEDPAVRLTTLREGLEQGGWSVVDRAQWAFSATRAQRYLEAHLPFHEEDGDEGQSVALFLQDRFTHSEVREFFEARVSAGDGPEELALLLRHMLPSDREALVRAVEDSQTPVSASLSEALLLLR